jgi:hypothetical protein
MNPKINDQLNLFNFKVNFKKEIQHTSCVISLRSVKWVASSVFFNFRKSVWAGLSISMIPHGYFLARIILPPTSTSSSDPTIANGKMA